MALIRSAGSAMWVCRLENIPETWLRPGRSDLSCTDTGTIATSDDVGQFAAVEQEPSQHAGHQGHHHVVDLDVEVVLDLLDVVEVQLGVGDVAVRR